MRISRYIIPLLLVGLTLMAAKCDKESEETKVDDATVTTIKADEAKVPLVFNFNGDYTSAWKKVDSLNRKGLYRSALGEVDGIISVAQKEKNYPEVIKAQLHRMRYNTYLTEDDYVKAIFEMDSITKNGEFPLKQIGHAITAKIYWGYYSANKYSIMNRTATQAFDNKDVRTWDLRKIAETITYHRLQSLTEEGKLQQVKTADFSKIIQFPTNSPNVESGNKYRSTLYDMLAIEALEFFSSAEFNLTTNQDKFRLDHDVLFSDSRSFVNHKFVKRDSLSNQYYVVQLMQDLERFNMNKQDPDLLVDLLKTRLNYMKNYAVVKDNKKKYLAMINKVISDYPESELTAEFHYMKASYYSANQNKDAGDDALKFGNRTAHSICQKVLSKYPGSIGAKQCAALLHSLETESLGVSVGSIRIPNTYTQLNVSFKNVQNLHYKVFKFPAEYNFYQNDLSSEKQYERIINDGKLIRTVHELLPDKKDYTQHSLVFALKPLPVGKYAIISSNEKDFAFGTKILEMTTFSVSNFVMNKISKGSGKTTFAIHNVQSGKPIPDVKVEWYDRKYNNKTRTYDYKKIKTNITSKNGTFNYTYSSSSSRSIFPKIIKGNDTLWNFRSLYLNEPYRYSYSNAGTKTHYFMDRKIYRPGQKIYFKGIVVQFDNGKNRIKANSTVKVSLYDPNYQVVKTLDLKTNDYGSFSGEFIAPDDRMLGGYRIQDAYGSSYFSIEEYKRPKFEVNFESLEGSYKLNKELTVVGSADAFAGNAIDGAEVNYRIKRSTYFPWWCYYRYGYRPNSADVEIESGTISTDEKGTFEIKFVAQEDPGVEGKFKPTYTYEITADVTDLNGETRSNTTRVRVGYTALQMKISVGNEIAKKNLKDFRITTKNLNGQKLDADVAVKVEKLSIPEQSFRSNYSTSEIEVYTENELRKYFPRVPLGEENNREEFPAEKIMLNSSINTGKVDTVAFERKNNWLPGLYKITAECIDAFGEKVQEQAYFSIYDDRDNKPYLNEVLWGKAVKRTINPGENAKVILSSKNRLYSKYIVTYEGDVIKEGVVKLEKEQMVLSIPTQSSMTEGFEVSVVAYYDGHLYTKDFNFYFPIESHNLNVELATFRDKMEPGSKEEWSVKISGPDKEKVAAEMVATMYDASLDEFSSNYFSMYLNWRDYRNKNNAKPSFSWPGLDLNANRNFSQYPIYNNPIPMRSYPYFNMFGFSPNYYRRNTGVLYKGYYDSWAGNGDVIETTSISANAAAPGSVDGAYEVALTEEAEEDEAFADYDALSSKEVAKAEAPMEGIADANNQSGEGRNDNNGSSSNLSNVKARTNFNETAFFKPHLRTNKEGDIIFSFEMPESLTEWKFLGLAHTKDLLVGSTSKSVVTQKELMVVPNVPRFLREGDKMILSSKISNISESDLNGEVQLFLVDVFTEAPIDSLMGNVNSIKSFNAKKGESTVANWEIIIPQDVSAVKYKFVAKAGDFSDGESSVLPVLTDRMMVTESIPLWINKKGSKTFKLDKLINSDKSSSLKHHGVTLEFTSNPAWYAVQSLPYIMEYPYECAEQTFARYYANTIASHVANSDPKIEKVFETWKNVDKEAFLSNLEKNQELKNIILQETPWVMQAQNEQEAKKRIGVLFDMHRMKKEQRKALKKIMEKQSSNGGWAWFPGMKESRYITTYIVTGMGHLNFMGVINSKTHLKEWQMLRKAIAFLDKEMLEDYQYLVSHYGKDYLDKYSVGYSQLQYLYARSYFDFPMSTPVKEAFDYYLGNAKKHWLTNNLQTEAMLALALERFEPEGTVQDDIMKSLSELAIHHEEMGMYYKSNLGGYYWYQAPIETQALLIEAFDVVAKDQDAVDELKVWLLKQKQTTHWKTTRATSEAIFALLMRGTKLLSNEEIVEIKLGDMKVEPSKTQAGTGYFKESWSGDEVKPEMGEITVTRETDGVSWGGFYWQYFEDLDKITGHASPLEIKKEIFKVMVGRNGEYMEPIESEGGSLEVGDKVRIRIEIHTDRDLEYVHLKDMRAAGFEPINVMSRYKWQDGLGYYESTKDASTNFFMDYVPKGSYVFEYDLRVFHKGDFSNGIAQMQCMYAPEFSSHSAGRRVVIK